MDSSPSADLVCVGRVLNGDTAAGDALVERLYPMVARVVRGRVTRRTEEADLSQMIFLRVFANLKQFSGNVPLEHWVSRIAVNVCLNEYRHEGKRPEIRRADMSPEQDQMLDLLARSEAEITPEQQVAARELVTVLLDQLAPKQRMIMTLIYLEGQTHEEAARLTGMTNLAVRLAAFRARQKMKKALRKLEEEQYS